MTKEPLCFVCRLPLKVRKDTVALYKGPDMGPGFNFAHRECYENNRTKDERIVSPCVEMDQLEEKSLEHYTSAIIPLLITFGFTVMFIQSFSNPIMPFIWGLMLAVVLLWLFLTIKRTYDQKKILKLP